MTSHARTHRESTHARTYLMCPPEYFTVEYAINPWMNPAHPVDPVLATRQWEQLRATYAGLAHSVRATDPERGLPDMVFAANGPGVTGGGVLGPSLRPRGRQGEAAPYMNWFRRSGYRVVEPVHVNEGEGDIIFAGRNIVAGYGFRSDRAVSVEAEASFGLPVTSVKLMDPRFYHLDTAFLVLDENTAAY